jgi:hypothetical protein
VTATEIIDEIKRLPPAEQAQVALLVSELKRTLTGKELAALAGKLAGENDPTKVQALKEQIMAGFYGEQQDA